SLSETSLRVGLSRRGFSAQEIPASSGAELDVQLEPVAPAAKQSLRPLTKFQKLRQWIVSRKQNEQAPLELTEYG
ncbi:hypothetical protein O5468_26680, partial [Escherichia coli]|nr:hypothetical protein [Escherichia coli]